jgi:tRNA (guanine-N7-)-methyltransferase
MRRLRHRKWTDDVLSANKDIGKDLSTFGEADLSQYSNLEIGCGEGGFLLRISKAHPEERYLGIEIDKNAFAMAVKHGSEVKKEQTNFLLLNAPVERIMSVFKDKQFQNIYINFPDPWPKKKQQKRRLSYPTNLKDYVRILKDDGTIYFRTDNDNLFLDSIGYFNSTDAYDIQVLNPFFSEKYDFLPTTEYETKFRAKGMPIHLIIARKKK